MHRRLVVAVLMLAVMSLPTTDAEADWEATGTVDGNEPAAVAVNGPGGTKIASYASHGKKKGSGKKGPAWVCGYYEPAASDFAVPAPAVGSDAVVPQDGVVYAFICLDAGTGAQTYAAFRRYDPADPLGGLFAGERAAELAVSRLPLPDPDLRLSPPAGAFQLVGVPTWFWVTDAWAPQSATASVGTIAATVTATPAVLEVDTGDGAHLTCSGAGIEWAEGRSSTCAHTYTRSSRHEPSGRYPVTATVTWDVAWTATDGDAGDLGTLTRDVTLDVLVHEAQAVSD